MRSKPIITDWKTSTSNTKKDSVKFFSTDKRFRFITGDDEAEIFVPNSGMRGEIRQNDWVQYDEQEGKKGLNAVKVKKT